MPTNLAFDPLYDLALFFAGHTFGGMLGQKSMGPESDAVFAHLPLQLVVPEPH